MHQVACNTLFLYYHFYILWHYTAYTQATLLTLHNQ